MQITEAIRRYGVSDTCTALFVVRVASPDITDIEDKIHAVVSGTLSSVSDLKRLTDWASVKKVLTLPFRSTICTEMVLQYHKLNTEVAVKEAAGDSAREHEIVDNIVISSVAMKSVVA